MEPGHTPHATAAAARTRALFPVVGVGASAGGLAATSKLLRNLGSAPGVAVVIVHHLDPTRDSSLVEILARATPLPVHAASDGARVEPNHVYVVPPSADLVIVDGILGVTPRTDTGGLHLPVDRFLESLARDRSVYAVGVLLTGTGSDGTAGIKAVKTEGGLTFAQDASAEYRSMPDSAIATGCVDFVLPPEEIARELLRIGEHAPPLAAAVDSPRHEADLQRILSEVRKSTGVDFASYKQTTVRRRVQRRLLVHGLEGLAEYAELLGHNPGEAAALCEEILIHVTSFFRDPEAFDGLKASVFPKLVENRPRDAPIRVWVPGCSTGEEVYSIAMSLLEFLAEANATDIPVKLFGTDVSVSAIDQARAGRYAASIEHDVTDVRRERFFVRSDGAYQIQKNVRDLCVFAKHDATRDPPFSGMDLVSCRNLIIYLGPALQDRILPTLHYALKEPGFLILGSSETPRTFPGFATLDAKNKIYVRTSAAPRLLLGFARARPAAPTAPGAIEAMAKASGPLDVHREADRIVLAEFAPPGVVVTDDLAIVQFRGKTGPFLEPTPGVASFDLLRMVREELRLPLRQAIDEARTKCGPARTGGLLIGPGPTSRPIALEVVPFGVASTTQRFFVVLFKETQPPPGTAAESRGPEGGTPPPLESQLRHELASTRDYLQSVIEQLEASNEELKAANEEIISSNEELLSTNEELQMAKEELEATNEELRTVNEEMTVRNVEGSRLNDDLSNVLSSVEIPIVMVSRDARLRRFTPAAAKVFHLGAADVGRPVGELESVIRDPDLAGMCASVLEHLGAVSRTVQDRQGRWRQLTVRPYMTADNRIDGTVVTAFDIDEVKKSGELLAQARDYAENIVDTVRECLVVLDRELRVRSANRAFYRTLAVGPDAVVGRHLYELGAGEWNIPVLRQRLEELREGEELEDFCVDKDFEGVGLRSFVLNARRIEHTSLLLLALEEVTERRRAEEAVKRTEIAFREMLTEAAEAILMTNASGQIVFANRAARRIFGFSADEMVGLPVDEIVPEHLRARHAEHRRAYAADPSARVMGAGLDVVGRRKDGTVFPIEVVLGTMSSEDGPLAVTFISDITLRRQSEEQIREYQSKLQRMAFDAAVAEERERRRIASDLHDRIGQALAVAQIKLASARDAVTGPARAAVGEAVALVAQSLVDTRTLTFDLCPPMLYELGLEEALSWLAEDVERRHGIHVELDDDGEDKPLDDATAALVFRAVRELLTNVLKHAQAGGATVSLRRTGGEVEVEVADEGVGFDAAKVAPPGSDGGYGLFSVREQISRLGGEVAVTSTPRQGTRVSLRVPLKTGAAPEGDDTEP
ncbi:MAG: PAS domain S-box protein [Myxococcales bacterium]|nr:PAS domain S-box protein [Myxococcales bacterium]